MGKRHTESDILKKIIIEIEKKINILHWSGPRLASECEMSYDSLKKILSGKVENPSFNTIISICQILDIHIDDIIYPKQSTKGQNYSLNNSDISHLSHHGIMLMKYILEMEQLQDNCVENNKNESIPVLFPVGNHSSEQMSAEAFSVENIPAKQYYKRYGNKLSFAIKVATHILEPIYFYNDILLVATDRIPIDGEIGIYENNGKYFIRQYSTEPQKGLYSLTRIGSTITESELSKYHSCGYILGIYR